MTDSSTPAEGLDPAARAGHGEGQGTPQRSRRSMALRASALMAAGSTFSRLLGFVRTFLMGMVLGGSASIAANAYSAANVLPNSIWILIGGGTLNAILVPAIVRSMKRPDGGNDYMSRLFTLVIVASGAVTALCMLAVPLLLTVANSRLDPGTMQAATVLAYWLMPQMMFSAVYIMFGQILNAHESFGPYQWAPAFNNVVAIIGAIIFLALWGSQPDGTEWTWAMIAVLALSQVGGVAAQGLLVFLWTRKIGLRIRLKWGFRGLGLGSLSKLGLWTLGMLFLGQIGVFAMRWSTNGAVSEVERLQSSGGNKAVRDLYPALATLDWSYTVFMIPQGIIAVALVTSVFPRMASQASDHDHAGAYRTYSAMNRVLLVPMILASVVLCVLAAPIMWVAIGGTSPTAAQANGLVLAGYVVGLTPFAALYLVKRFFYAYEDARMSFMMQIPVTLVSLLALWPILAFVDPRYATATATVVSSLGNLIAWLMGLAFMRRKLSQLGVDSSTMSGTSTLLTLVRLLIAAAFAAAAGWGLLALAGDLTWTSRPTAVLVGLVVASAMSLVFIAAAFVLRVSEVREAGSIIGRRLRRR
ncbi:MAG: lipid II flippase MurJ [Dermabacter sp.]|nr:lipid II flippase MurJ [Dermabacter sp.]